MLGKYTDITQKLSVKHFWKLIKSKLFADAHAGTINVGLVGVGGWGQVNAVSLMNTARYNIIGIYDVNKSVMEKFCSRYKTKPYLSYKDLISNPDVTAVVLSVPNQYHFTMTKKAIENGKHVFVEKPLALTSGECVKLADISRRKKKILMVGHQIRREPAFKKIKDIHDSNELGPPIFVHGIRTLFKKNTEQPCNSKWYPDGSMGQLGIHFVDTMIYLFGAPKSWCGWRKNSFDTEKDPLEWGHLEMHFNNGVSGVVDSSFTAPARLEFNLYFQRGQLRLESGRFELKKHANGTWHRIELPVFSGSEAQFFEFAECITNDKKPETDAHSSALMAEIISSLRSENQHGTPTSGTGNPIIESFDRLA